MFNVAFDYDGVITSNIQHYHQLASDFVRSGHEVTVITAANKNRLGDIVKTLLRTNFPSTQIVSRPKEFISTTYNIGAWKKEQLIKYKIDLWFENDVKFYELAGIDFSDLDTVIVRI